MEQWPFKTRLQTETNTHDLKISITKPTGYGECVDANNKRTHHNT